MRVLIRVICLLLLLVLAVVCCELLRSRKGVTIVKNGRPMAVVVVATDATHVAEYAAKEFIYHIQKATGVTLTNASEDKIPNRPSGRVYIGNCKATRQAGIKVAKLPAEGTVIKTTRKALFIAGEDGDGDPLFYGRRHKEETKGFHTHAGTLWGVYEILERVLKVRWLWPGELGVYVPSTKTVKVGKIDETIEPRFFQRKVRIQGSNVNQELGFLPTDWAAYTNARAVFLRRHRMGKSKHIRYGHAFGRSNWWDKYGQTHSNWFQLVQMKDGSHRRGPEDLQDPKYSMCASDTNLHQEIVRLWSEENTNKPRPWRNINCCENDFPGSCTCTSCVSWDGPQTMNIPLRFLPIMAVNRVVSDRYARWWRDVQKLAVTNDPNATVVGWAYKNYYPAPCSSIALNKNIIVGLVPDIFFPRCMNEQQWVTEQWDGWAATGAQLLLRPNYYLDGYCMPHIFVHQFADEFQHAAKQSMVGTDFDALTGQWATQGPNLYALFRLHLHPERNVDVLLQEYYDAFGPAKHNVKAYFDYWENYMWANLTNHLKIAEERKAGWRQYPRKADAMFPTNSFQAAELLLARAAQDAACQSEFSNRVAFLQRGLNHAKLCADIPRADLSPVARAKAFDELLRIRRERETDEDWIANFSYFAAAESNVWENLLVLDPDDVNVKSLSAAVTPLQKNTKISVRGGHTFLALLKAGQRVRMQIERRQVHNYKSPIEYRIFDPADGFVEKGTVSTGKQVLVDVPGAMDGVYVVSLDTGRNAAYVTLLNDHAVLAGRKVDLYPGTSPLFFYVPKGVARFSVTLESPAPGETAGITICDPDNKEAKYVETGGTTTLCVAEIHVNTGQWGQAWSIQAKPASTGDWFADYSIELGTNLPPYWAHAADRLLIPK